MCWEVRSERSVYAGGGLEIRIADVELPGGRREERHLVRVAPCAGAVVVDRRERVLLVRRHRLATGSRAWEIPLGEVAEGELPQEAACRAVEEQAGWRPGPVAPLLAVQPANRISDGLHYVYRGESPVYLGPPAGRGRAEWVPLSRVRRLADEGEIVCGTTLSAVLRVLLDRPAPAPPPGARERPLLLRDLPGLET
ncbi:NUDIX domain-containing protein [Nonomuraea sp. NPDC050783]|uniref:NUDIX domain-containing protein n=1 Tax=Nonomuraea sp. NPDC050783 TaxID=3154634 RepID=UPI0034658DE6